MYTCYCGEQKTESLPKLSGDYRITYDAGEGSGAPLPQGKAKGKAMIISPVVPTRDGFDFLGWALTQDTEQPEYLAGGEFNIDADTTLYAVWRRQTIPLTEIAVERSYISLLPGESCDFAFPRYPRMLLTIPSPQTVGIPRLSSAAALPSRLSLPERR